MQSMFPFEKNRYFPYKRMRSEDFSRELRYIDHKFQCLNRWAFGAGVAFGLEVQRLENALLVSQGMAVDGQGRCIIVDEPAVCRIQTLDGFQTLKGETALLWLTYREEPREPMRVNQEQGEKEEFAVSAERYDFRLTELTAQPLDTVDRLLYFDRELYRDETVRVRQIMPCVLSSQRAVKLRLIVENLTLEKLKAELTYRPRLPGFHMEGREDIDLKETLTLASGATVVELTLLPDTTAQAAPFTLTEEDFSLRIQERELGLSGPIEKELKVVPGDPMEELTGRVQEMSVQELWGEGETLGVPLAEIRFIRYQDSVLLDDVVPLYHHQRTHLPAVEQRLDTCRQFFPPSAARCAPVQVEKPASCPERDWTRYMTTGVVTLNAGLHLREGKILCTGEILHTLGPGTVYVDFGVENVYPSGEEGRNVSDLLLGDVSLFVPAEGEYEHNFDRGVRVHPEKGTFELAVRLRGDLHEAALQLRWFAWRPEGCIIRTEEKGDLVRLEPNVVYAAPGDIIHFAPVFRGNTLPCEFFVPAKRSGMITPDGVYTAPERAGLYQICAQVQGDTESQVGAFVIVRSQEEGAEDEAADLP